jgi:hypothetical protein
MKADKYTTLRKSRYRKQLNETNDCSVFAIAIACRLSYKKAHEVMESFGRKRRKGVDTFTIMRAAQWLGFELTAVKNLKQKSGSRYTPKTIGEKLKRGYHLAFVHRHVLGVVNGTVYDWTEDRNHRITEAYKITRKRK